MTRELPKWGSDAALLPVGIVLFVIGLLALAWTCGCSLSRWEAEDGHTKVRHGLVIRFGTEIYIGDDGHGETEADWTASGERAEPSTQPAE